MKILCAVDGSPGSEKTVQALAEHAWSPGTTIRILAVAEKVHPTVLELVATRQRPSDVQHSLDVRCENAAVTAASKLKRVGITSESESCEGNPKSVIVEHARRWGAELIVVGLYRRSRLCRLLFGSVAKTVVANAPCSVLVIRHSENAAE
jgi:nucleotide-binding universal stress UspA family protein